MEEISLHKERWREKIREANGDSWPPVFCILFLFIFSFVPLLHHSALLFILLHPPYKYLTLLQQSSAGYVGLFVKWPTTLSVLSNYYYATSL